MKLMDPGASRATPDNVRAAPLTALGGLRVGLLSNGKVNADVLLKETADLFAERDGCTVQSMVFKHNASAPAAAEVIEKLAAECDFLLTANGD